MMVKTLYRHLFIQINQHPDTFIRSRFKDIVRNEFRM